MSYFSPLSITDQNIESSEGSSKRLKDEFLQYKNQLSIVSRETLSLRDLNAPGCHLPSLFHVKHIRKFICRYKKS